MITDSAGDTYDTTLARIETETKKIRGRLDGSTGGTNVTVRFASTASLL